MNNNKTNNQSVLDKFPHLCKQCAFPLIDFDYCEFCVWLNSEQYKLNYNKEYFKIDLKPQYYIKKQLDNLYKRWKEETAGLSSTTRMIEHDLYQQIIEMGKSVVPYIILNLRYNPDHLFHALSIITGEQAIKAEHSGQLDNMAADWIEWWLEKCAEWKAQHGLVLRGIILDVSFGSTPEKGKLLFVDLADGRRIIVPVSWYPRLDRLTVTELSNEPWEICGHGRGIHWPNLDEDLSLEGILKGKPAPALREIKNGR